MKNLTVNAIEALQRAQQKAFEKGHAELEPLHLLWALLRETGPGHQGPARARDRPGTDRADRRAGARIPARGQVKEVPAASRELQKVLLEAPGRRASKRAGGMVGTRELLLALAADTGRAGSVLQTFDAHADKDRPRARADGRRPGLPGRGRESARPTPANRRWAKYARDLCAAARAGKIDPIIGRDEEIRRVIQILSAAHQEQPRADRVCRAWARPRSSRGSRAASSRATCPRA